MQERAATNDQNLISKAKQIMRTKNLYEVLGVDRGANDNIIKKAYRKVFQLKLS